MDELVYPRERTLGRVTLVLGLLFWLLLIAGTFGTALIGLALGFLIYLFTQSALIAHIKGNGVALSETQFPDLHAQFSACCARLQILEPPQVYVLGGNGALNAFATKFLGRQYVVLLSDVVDAMEQHPDGVRFYLGHELAHLRLKHLHIGHLLRWPALWLPLLGAAYSRARESSCDRHGLACCSSPDNAARALAALATGAQRWRQLDTAAYREQALQAPGFWMSFHELVAGYPWLHKRAARVLQPEAALPPRHGLAYLPALFVPYAGRLGSGFGLIIMAYIIGVLAAVAIPAYKDYTAKAVLTNAVSASHSARAALEAYYREHESVPANLTQAGIPAQLPNEVRLSLNPKGMVLSVDTRQGTLLFVPSADDQGRIRWACKPGEGLRPAQVPTNCKDESRQ